MDAYAEASRREKAAKSEKDELKAKIIQLAKTMNAARLVGQVDAVKVNWGEKLKLPTTSDKKDYEALVARVKELRKWEEFSRLNTQGLEKALREPNLLEWNGVAREIHEEHLG